MQTITLDTVMNYNDTPVKDLQHPPVLRVVVIEEHRDYCESIQEQCNSIRGVYLVNESVVYHHCSFLPEYELQYLYSIVDSELSGVLHEQLVGDVEEGGRESHPDIYLNHLPMSAGWTTPPLTHLIDPEEVAEGRTIGELMKDVKEYLICNNPF